MEDPSKRSEIHAPEKHEVAIECSHCDSMIYRTKARGVDMIVHCAGCNTRYVLDDEGLRES